MQENRSSGLPTRPDTKRSVQLKENGSSRLARTSHEFLLMLLEMYKHFYSN